MRQNIGLFCLTLGSILLSVRVFLGGPISNWKDLPLEQRWFYRLLRKKSIFEKLVDRDQKIPSLGTNHKLLGRLQRDLPILAFILMIIGFFLCLDYRAFGL